MKQIQDDRQELEKSKQLLKKYQQDLTAERDQVTILEQQIIPCLIAQNGMLLQMWDAEQAIQVRTRVAANNPEGV